MPNFLTAIQEARLEAGLSYEALARRMGPTTSRGYLHRVFKGADKPGRNVVLRLALALGLSVQQAHELLVSGGYAGLYESRQTQSPPEGRADVLPSSQAHAAALQGARRRES
jgi:transcriptional regulator with XRE-family HTH domain